MTEEAFYQQYVNQTADGKLVVIKNGSPGAGEVLAIAGATRTSNGVTAAVNLAAACYSEYLAG